MEKQWYAVYTKPRWEKKVAESLMRNRLESYCPLNRVVRQWSDRKKVIEEPLFNSYVFTRLLPSEQTLVRQINGVVNFVYWLGRPAIIRAEEIQVIRDFLHQYQNVKLEKAPIHIDDDVQIIQGPLVEMIGKVVSVNHKLVRVIIKSLGYALTAELERHHVKACCNSKLFV
ncbi:MAG TPA: UpxY family transcription antiterminator [Sphingobacteriaceae bacterium]